MNQAERQGFEVTLFHRMHDRTERGGVSNLTKLAALLLTGRTRPPIDVVLEDAAVLIELAMRAELRDADALRARYGVTTWGKGPATKAPA